MLGSHAPSIHGPSSCWSVASWQRAWSERDLGNVLLIIALALLLGAQQLIEPRHRLINNIDDPAINYPFLKQTVPIWLLMLLAIGVPLGAMVIIYYLQRRLPHARKELYVVVFAFLFSLLLTLNFTEFTKRVTGRPRPNFREYSGYQGNGTYTGSAHSVADAYMSFVSGHTSTSFSGLGFLALYLFRLCFPANFSSRESAHRFHQNQGYKTLLCFIPIVLATWIGLTRIIDYWHNFDDVAIGALLGLGVTSLTFQLHVAWHWASLHPDEESAVTRLVDGRESPDLERQEQQQQLHTAPRGSVASLNRQRASVGDESAPPEFVARGSGSRSVTNLPSPGVQLFSGAGSARRNSGPSTYPSYGGHDVDARSGGGNGAAALASPTGTRRQAGGPTLAATSSSSEKDADELDAPLLHA